MQNNKYQIKINHVINYITQNIYQTITLDQLAEVSGFSKFHFHRIFKTLVGESVYKFIKRIQLEKAAYLLIYNPEEEITEIALDCGFSSSQNFSKTFKAFYNITPTQFRKENDLKNKTKIKNPGNLLRNTKNNKNSLIHYNDIIEKKSFNTFEIVNNESLLGKVVIKTLPDLHVAYLRHIGEYTPENLSPLYRDLFAWANPRNLITDKSLVLGVVWDNISITEDDKCRYDACITVHDDFKSDEMNFQTLQGGLYAVYSCEIINSNFHEPWDLFFRNWLPASKYLPDDKPAYEIFYNLNDNSSQSKLVTDICIPLKK